MLQVGGLVAGRCAQCRNELELIERSFAAASRTPRVDAAIDAGWRRMSARIEQDATRREAAVGGSPSGWRDAAARVLRWLQPRSAWGWAASAAALAALVVGYPMLGTSEHDAAPYRVLTSPPSAAAEAPLLLRVKLKTDTAPALLVQWLVDARTPTTLRRESGSQYLVELTPPADFQAMNRVFEQLSRRAEVENVQIVVVQGQ